jgi:hypothetical protein
MKNNLLLFIGVLLLTACSKEDIFPNKNIEMNIDTRLPLDVNGYSRITVLEVLEMLQTAFTHMQYAWVPTVSNEPAVFWYSGMR